MPHTETTDDTIDESRRLMSSLGIDPVEVGLLEPNSPSLETGYEWSPICHAVYRAFTGEIAESVSRFENLTGSKSEPDFVRGLAGLFLWVEAFDSPRFAPELGPLSFGRLQRNVLGSQLAVQVIDQELAELNHQGQFQIERDCLRLCRAHIGFAEAKRPDYLRDLRLIAAEGATSYLRGHANMLLAADLRMAAPNTHRFKSAIKEAQQQLFPTENKAIRRAAEDVDNSNDVWHPHDPSTEDDDDVLDPSTSESEETKRQDGASVEVRALSDLFDQVTDRDLMLLPYPQRSRMSQLLAQVELTSGLELASSHLEAPDMGRLDKPQSVQTDSDGAVEEFTADLQEPMSFCDLFEQITNFDHTTVSRREFNGLKQWILEVLLSGADATELKEVADTAMGRRTDLFNDLVFKTCRPSLKRAQIWLRQQSERTLSDNDKRTISNALQWLCETHKFSLTYTDEKHPTPVKCTISTDVRSRDDRVIFRFRGTGTDQEKLKSPVQLPKGLELS